MAKQTTTTSQTQTTSTNATLATEAARLEKKKKKGAARLPSRVQQRHSRGTARDSMLCARPTLASSDSQRLAATESRTQGAQPVAR